MFSIIQEIGCGSSTPGRQIRVLLALDRDLEVVLVLDNNPKLWNKQIGRGDRTHEQNVGAELAGTRDEVEALLGGEGMRVSR